MGDKTENVNEIVQNNNADENSFTSLLIKRNWYEIQIKQLLGNADSSFLLYDIYFYKGFDIRYNNGKAYNIVFHKNFAEDIIPRINMDTSIKQVINDLGQPQFQDKSLDLIGYKKDNYYIFFTGTEAIKEISVYRRDRDFDKYGLLKMIDKLKSTDYADFCYYFYDIANKYLGNIDNFYFAGYSGIELYNRGIYTSCGPEDLQPYLEFTIYGNYEGYITPEIYLPDDSDKVKGLNSEYFSFVLDKDWIFEKEKDRLSQVDSSIYLEKSEISPDGNKRIYMWGEPNTDWTSIGIQYLDRSQADFQLDYHLYDDFIEDGVFWINDRNIIFPCLNNEIYIYDLISKTIKSFYVDNRWLVIEILSVKDGIITYRNFADLEDKNTYKINYKINKNGEVFFDN